MDNKFRPTVEVVLADLCAAGLYIIEIPPVDGKPSKAPKRKNWNKPRGPENPNGYSNDSGSFRLRKGSNISLYHAASNTLAVDLDNLSLAQKLFNELTDFNLFCWLESCQRFEIKSPKQNRGKLVFRLPLGFLGTGLRQLKQGGKVIFELRSGNCQDVIYGEHPEGGYYEIIGNPAAIPVAPPELLDILEQWDQHWKKHFESAFSNEQGPLKSLSTLPLNQISRLGRRDPIKEFNMSHTVVDILLRNGYVQKSSDRFLRPGSESKAPGAVIMRNYEGGVERVYSHGGDILNDGYPHDAFDCYRLFECGGDLDSALAWNTDITRHNRQLYKLEKTKLTRGAKKEHYQRNEKGNNAGMLAGLLQWDVTIRFVGRPPARKYLVADMILIGKVSLLAASGGVGKSYLLLSLAYRIATYYEGSDQPAFSAFGRLERGGTAVVICAEDDSIEIHNRLDVMGERPESGRLIVMPLPDVGGAKALFEINPHSRAPDTTQEFHSLHAQLKAIRDLALIVLDPLQALCGGLDLNLPQHGQHVCTVLAHLASDTGAAVMVSHHLRKGGNIKSPEEARDAIRGTGGLVDGVRLALAVWPDNTDEAKKVCKQLSLDWQRNRVCNLAVVKANFRADLCVKTLVRGDDGLLADRSFELHKVTPKATDILDKLLGEIELAAEKGRPFTKTGQNGIYERRHELSSYFQDWGRARIQDAVQSLLNAGRIICFKLPGRGKTGRVWLGMPAGALAGGRDSET